MCIGWYPVIHSKKRSVNLTLKVSILTLLKIIYGPNLSGVKSTLFAVLNFSVNIAPYSVEKLHSKCKVFTLAIVVQILHYGVFNTPGVALSVINKVFFSVQK